MSPAPEIIATPPITLPAPTAPTPPAAPTPSTDWGKVVTGAFGAATEYERQQTAQIQRQTEKLRQQAKPGAPAPAPAAGGVATSTLVVGGIVLGGLFLTGILVVVATRA